MCDTMKVFKTDGSSIVCNHDEFMRLLIKGKVRAYEEVHPDEMTIDMYEELEG